MRDRLFAGLLTGPNLNCRPHSSRQRIDWSQLERLQDGSPEAVFRELLSKRKVRVTARVTAPPSAKGAQGKPAPVPSNGNGTATAVEALEPSKPDPKQTPWSLQQTVLGKLRHIVEDARTYEQDTGVHVLNVGFPLLSLPATSGKRSGWGARRILAPVAFVPVRLQIRAGATVTVDVACEGRGVDVVVPNAALLAWLQQQHGPMPDDLFADEEGADPWGEIATLVRLVADRLGVDTPECFRQGAPSLGKSEDGVGTSIGLTAVPKADEDALNAPRILLSAVLGVFPMNNQGLLRDTVAMIDEPALDPLRSFLSVRVDEEDDPNEPPAAEAPEPNVTPPKGRVMHSERFIAPLDPCQAKAVRMARECPALVIHGPPGTGKSQTITNIIGDHLARGERVLMVCDKRTALDVVANRLEHLGLGNLTAVVHDPQLDQRDLYRAVREQLEQLADTSPATPNERPLAKLDKELQQVHQELTDAWSAVMQPTEDGRSFHELAGRWLELSGADASPPEVCAGQMPRHADLIEHEHAIQQIIDRAAEIDLPRHAWTDASGIELGDFLSRPVEPMRRGLQDCLVAAQKADATRTEGLLPFDLELPLQRQAMDRSRCADLLKAVSDWLEDRILVSATRLPLATVKSLHEQVRSLELPQPEQRLDSELLAILGPQCPSLPVIVEQLATLREWLAVADRWYAFAFFQRKQAAAAVLRKSGLAPGVAEARRLAGFLDGLRQRLTVQARIDDVLTQMKSPRAPGGPACLPDPEQQQLVLSLGFLLGLRLTDRRVLGETRDAGAITIEDALADSGNRLELINRLRQSEIRAEALSRLNDTLAQTGLFAARWLLEFDAQGRRGEWLEIRIQRLIDQFDELDDVLRIGQQIAALPTACQPAVRSVLQSEPPAKGCAAAEASGANHGPEDALPDSNAASASERVTRAITRPARLDRCAPAAAMFDAFTAWTNLERTVLFHELAARIRSFPLSQQLDPTGLQKAFDRYRALEAQKQERVRDLIQQGWLARQQSGLLVGTGSRLNGAGADLRRRLTLRGERAMRLRQVIAVGQETEDGDPLFDLRPFWMASPETVAQIFPRKPMFDVVIFDEASQCRLEEALPVLTRAKRVVIAGDPKQLPPTRFFETTLAASGDEDEPETDQELFETHQGDVEDLLEGALGLSIAQCYLDVHYRSRNSDLIAFSNQEFYDSRLQPIPGHPARKAEHAPIVLHPVNGTYHERQNETEADAVVELVRELLARENPPSIGIACFNLTQRDLIVDKLDELATADAEFGERLATARERRGEATFEGLFVKNLENVQGDERDQIVISTTYGPDPQGRFYRRFGPLGREGGGRRLNVLVTRAREAVHLVTSIPEHVYGNLPPVPPGQTPGGGWLLFAYLAFAREMARLYEEPEDEAETPSAVKHPSPFATALGRWLWQKHGRRSDLHFGNDGFCVDVALRDPDDPATVTQGVLCDGTRYAGSDDPAAWDAFRTAILEATGWTLQRVWSPAFFRDPQRVAARLLKEASRSDARGERGA